MADGVAALAESIRLAPERRTMAERDADFAVARTRPDSRQLCTR